MGEPIVSADPRGGLSQLVELPDASQNKHAWPRSRHADNLQAWI
jgi:hypothetical protein